MKVIPDESVAVVGMRVSVTPPITVVCMMVVDEGVVVVFPLSNELELEEKLVVTFRVVLVLEIVEGRRWRKRTVWK